MVKLGNVYLDGTKIQANASKHKAVHRAAMSYEYMKRLEEQSESEISKLLAIASGTNETEKPEKMDIRSGLF
ncbi:hypothetical protein Dfri01_38290 [Dyadobacter frigoris]|nr:hypothetical protein Dfri01_38290 [Dyadobacter frigoris]